MVGYRLNGIGNYSYGPRNLDSLRTTIEGRSDRSRVRIVDIRTRCILAGMQSVCIYALKVVGPYCW